MSLRNVYDTSAYMMEQVCQQHATGVLTELQRHPHIQLVTHQQAPMTHRDWRWTRCISAVDWNAPLPTRCLKYCLQLQFVYKHNWVVVGHPNVSGRSIMFIAGLVDDNWLNHQRDAEVTFSGAVYDFASLWKRIDKNKHLVPLHFRYWTATNNG